MPRPQSQRNLYDLSHFIYPVSEIGRLRALDVIPVLPGDSHDIELQGVINLSPLRRQLFVDAKVDVFAFFVPERHIEGDKWIRFIREGVDENETFASQNVGDATTDGYGTRISNAVPAWLHKGYVKIWNRYFRAPTHGGELSETTILGTSDREMGRPCGHLPCYWSTPIEGEVTTADQRVGLAGGQVDLIDLARGAGRLKTERRREWLAQRYLDVLSNTWGTGVNIDADERPALLYRKSFWMSGFNVYGTDQGSLGNYSGAAEAVFDCKMPPKFFQEHGKLWLMALVRFPPLLSEERHRLEGIPNPSYKDFGMDPDVSRREPPIDLDIADITHATGSSVIGKVPFAQEYRTHPNRISAFFDVLEGLPFIWDRGFNKAKALYIVPSAYDGVFRNLSLKHWHGKIRANHMAKRHVPKVFSSVFAGTGME